MEAASLLDDDLVSTLPPILRSLLVTDGTISRVLEAYFWEPIDTEMIRQERLETFRELTKVVRQTAGVWARHLGVAPSAPVALRDYVIRHTGQTVAQITEVFPAERYE